MRVTYIHAYQEKHGKRNSIMYVIMPLVVNDLKGRKGLFGCGLVLVNSAFPGDYGGLPLAQAVSE